MRGRRPASEGGRYKDEIRWIRVRRETPVGPLASHGLASSFQAVPAMSRWIHGVSPANSRMNHAPVIAAAAFAAANILNVGEAALDEFAILVVHRHLPHFFAGGFGAGKQLVGPGLIGAEHADVDVGEGDDDRLR